MQPYDFEQVWISNLVLKKTTKSIYPKLSWNIGTPYTYTILYLQINWLSDYFVITQNVKHFGLCNEDQLKPYSIRKQTYVFIQFDYKSTVTVSVTLQQCPIAIYISLLTLYFGTFLDLYIIKWILAICVSTCIWWNRIWMFFVSSLMN